jgi:hypothetical protein
MTVPALTPGELQKLQKDVGQHAAMAAQMSQAVGWTQLDLLLNDLNKQCSAGGRPELLPLLEVRTSKYILP